MLQKRQPQVRRSYFSRIAEHVGKPLREQCDEITHEPLPERWVDLINYLNAREEEARRVATLAHQPLANGPPARGGPNVAATLKYVVPLLIGALALITAVVFAVPTVPLWSRISMAEVQVAP